MYLFKKYKEGITHFVALLFIYMMFGKDMYVSAVCLFGYLLSYIRSEYVK